MVDPSEDTTVSPLHATHGTDFEAFTGHHARSLDEKARLTLPAGPWRGAFEAVAYVGGWRDGSIAVWPKAQFHAALDKIAEQERAGLVPGGSLEVFRRNVHAVPIDGQGRLTVPPQVRERRPIGAGANVVVDGEGDRLVLRRAEDVRADAELYDDVVDLFDNR
jgi:DNA-binding transcriptional regulator/RsmH inhibitor MraZ